MNMEKLYIQIKKCTGRMWYRDIVGTILRVEPYVTDDGFVCMDYWTILWKSKKEFLKCVKGTGKFNDSYWLFKVDCGPPSHKIKVRVRSIRCL